MIELLIIEALLLLMLVAGFSLGAWSGYRAAIIKMDQELASIGVSRNAREHLGKMMRNQADA